VQSIFNNKNYEVRVSGNANKKIEIKMIDNTNENHNNECFKLIMNESEKTINIANLKYPRQENCLLSGPNILNKLIELANQLECSIFIESDASSLTLSNPKQTIVDLAVFKILLDGESFYNKYGFQSNEYPQEIKYNKKIRDSPVRKRDFEIAEDDIATMEQAFGITINDKTTFVDVARTIKTIIQHRQYSDEVALAIKMLVKDYFKYLINYKTSNLEYNENFKII
jgi:hypothetical protein